MPGPLAAAVGLGIGSSLIGAGASKSAAKTQARSADAQMALQGQMFDRMDELQGGLYDDQIGTIGKNTGVAQNAARGAHHTAMDLAGDLRRSGQATNVGTRNKNALLNTQSLNINNRRTQDAQWDSVRAGNNALMSGLRRSQTTRNQNIAGFEDARDKSLGYFEPSIDRGNDAGAAYAYNLGLGGKPAGYTGLQESEGTKYLMNTGRQEIEGGAAGAGGLYSGATMAALEKKRQGLASLDKDNQMSQMMQLAGLGQSAGNSAASLRTGAASAIAGERGDYRDTANALDATRTASNIGARNLGTATMNALRDQYTNRGIGINNAYQTNQYGIGQDYANSMTGAADTRAGRMIDIANNNTANLGAARANRANLQGNAAANYTTGMSAALSNKGDAQAAGTIGTANAIMGGANNALGMYGMMGGTFGSQAAQGAATGSPFANPFATMKPNFWQGAQY
jgi:hypothetical protein